MARKRTLGITGFKIEAFSKEHDLTVRYMYYPEHGGTRITPPDPEDAEIRKMTCQNGHKWEERDLRKEDHDRLIEQCIEEGRILSETLVQKPD